MHKQTAMARVILKKIREGDEVGSGKLQRDHSER